MRSMFWSPQAFGRHDLLAKPGPRQHQDKRPPTKDAAIARETWWSLRESEHSPNLLRAAPPAGRPAPWRDRRRRSQPIRPALTQWRRLLLDASLLGLIRRAILRRLEICPSLRTLFLCPHRRS